MGIKTAWMEKLIADDWTLDPKIFAYQLNFRPSEYVKGLLAESWEFTGPSTYVIHLRKGIHWQNIPPANGREFIADDVLFHYNRLCGLGGGFTTPSPFAPSVATYKDLISITATDKYTVVFNWKTPNAEFIMETVNSNGSDQFMENSDAVKQWGDVNDWHHAIGTGPFVLKDFVPGSSASLVKNTDYWGYDERYPQNKLPYIDSLTFLIITDTSTALAAMRTGKIDALSQMSLQTAQSLQKTNPDIVQIPSCPPQATTVDPRNDTPPFNDIRVRKAMQMALDLPTIASSYYSGTVLPHPASMTSMFFGLGYGFQYDEWPQDLKDEYAYNPTTAKKLLADAGYPNGFKTNIVVDSAADSNLLQIVKSYFAQIGIDMEIRVMDPASWITFVRSNKKYDQMAQDTTGTLGFNYEPIRTLNRFKTGYAANYNMVSDPVFDTFYPKAMAANSTQEIKQIVRDANERVARQHYVISLLQTNLYTFEQPWLKGYNGQYGVAEGGSGPVLIFFYEARFWIDQNLKKSMGH